MPAYSGLYDGVFGDGYAALRRQSKPPMLRGITRVLMQKSGMWGAVTAVGRKSPATVARVVTDRADVTVPGTFTWPARTLARDVTISNLGNPLQGGTGTALDSKARVAAPSAADLVAGFDTTLNVGYTADLANSGVTAPTVVGKVAP